MNCIRIICKADTKDIEMFAQMVKEANDVLERKKPKKQLGLRKFEKDKRLRRIFFTSLF
jgi:hypothetical protein